MAAYSSCPGSVGMKVKYITKLAANLKGKLSNIVEKRRRRYKKGQGVTKKGRALRHSSLL
jgi:hypothetical protein